MKAQRLACLTALWLVVALAGCGRQPPPALLAEPLSLVVSTDMGLDDMLALLALASRPDVELRAVAVSGVGLATCAGGVPNARALLALAGRPEVPVACGREQPLRGERAFPATWRAATDQAYGVALPAAPDPGHAEGDAADLIATAAAGTPPVLLALGPLTDLAEALGREPGLAGRIAGVIWMGGALDVAGNLGADAVDNQVAEWNSYVDPLAVEAVLAAGVPLTLVPLDATNDVPVSAGFLRRLRGENVTPAAATAYALLDANREQLEAGQLFFWDPAAAALAIDPALARWERRRLAVEVADGPQSGALLADEAGAELRVATGMERERFEGWLIDTLNGRFAVEQAP